MAATVPEQCYSSESSSGIEAPAIRKTRGESFRVLLHRGSARLDKLESSWRRRLRERPRDFCTSPTLTDDEDERNRHSNCTAILEKALRDASSRFPATRSAVRGRKDIRAALRGLPRPSEVVQSIEDGSASNFGLGIEARKSHSRRIKATLLGAQYLTREGMPIPVPVSILSRHGLEKYTRYLKVPAQDLHIRYPFTERNLLSKHYRGKLLFVDQFGGRGKRKKRRPEPSYTSDSGYSIDIDYWYEIGHSNSDIGTPVKKEGESPEIMDSPHKKECSSENTLEISNADLVKQILAENENVSEESDKDSMVDVEQSPSSAAQGLGQESPAKPEVDIFSNIMFLLQKDPTVLQKPSQQDSEKDDIKTKEDDATRNEEDKRKDLPGARKECSVNGNVVTAKDEGESRTGSEGLRPDDVKPIKGLSKFDCEKQKGLKFCSQVQSAKRIRNASITVIEPNRKIRKPHDLSRPIDLSKDERLDYGCAEGMLQKMGFTGRLGAKGDGVAEPLSELTTSYGRSGIGLYSRQQQEDRNLNLKTARKPPPYRDAKNITSFASKADVNHADIENEQFVVVPDPIGGVGGVRNGQRGRNPAISPINDDMDENDEYETENEDERVDNGRRAILLDVDALIKNNQQRRVEAFQRLIEGLNNLPKDFSLEKLLGDEKKVLCDADCIIKIAEAEGLDKTKEVYNYMQEKLDKAFQEGKEIELDVKLVGMLHRYCKGLYFGLFFNGSKERLEAEMGSMREDWNEGDATCVLPEMLVQAPCVTVKAGDEWPYGNSWRDLLCQVGVQAAQGAFLVGPNLIRNAVNYGSAAAIVLGSRVMTKTHHKDGFRICVHGDQGDDNKNLEVQVEGKTGEVQNGATELFDIILKGRRKRLKRRRVLAYIEAEHMWFCGLEELGQNDGVGNNAEHSMIRVYNLNTLEWVHNEAIRPLTRRDYRKMRDIGFPGVCEPCDINDF